MTFGNATTRRSGPPLGAGRGSRALEASQIASPRLAANFEAARWDRATTALGVSLKELEVIRALFRGDSEKEAAVRLALPQRTVHARLERVHARLGVRTRTELLVTVLAAVLAD